MFVCGSLTLNYWINIGNNIKHFLEMKVSSNKHMILSARIKNELMTVPLVT